MKIVKKISGILLTLCLTMALLPTASFADGAEARIGNVNYATLQMAIDNVKDGDTITVLKDITLTKDSVLKIAPETPKSFTIDLNQKQIAYPNDNEWDIAALNIDKPVTLNIKNGRIDAGNEDHSAIEISCVEKTPVKLTVTATTINAGYAAIYNYCSAGNTGRNKITLKDVNLISDGYGVNADRADIIFESGTITTTNDETFYLDDCSLTVNAGEFITTDDTCVDLSQCTVVINGGHFKSSDDNAIYAYESEIKLNGGIFEAPDKAIYANDSNIYLGENLKSIFVDGTVNDYLNSTYVGIVKDKVDAAGDASDNNQTGAIKQNGTAASGSGVNGSDNKHPKTGDNSPLGLYAGIMGLSLISIILILLFGRKHKSVK